MGRRLPPRPHATRVPQQAGTAALEYALVLPVLLVLLLGALDAGRVMWLAVTPLDRAVDVAARCAAIDTTTCGTPAQITAYAAAQAFGTTMTASVFTATIAACGAKVTGSLPFAFVTPWPGKRTISLTAMACYPFK